MKKLSGVLLLALAAACASNSNTGKAPDPTKSASEASGDAALTAKVKSAIATDVGARTAAAVNVDTNRGVVQLTGFVDSKDHAAKVETAAKKVDGVKSVKNDVRIKSPS